MTEAFVSQEVPSRAHELSRILDLLDLNSYGYRHEGLSQPWPEGHFYGGLMIAQAIVAAARSPLVFGVPAEVHCTFIRPAAQSVPVRYDVEIIGRGRRTAFCRVTATQVGTIATFDVVLARWLPTTPVGTGTPAVVPRPESLSPLHETCRRIGSPTAPWWTEPRAVDLRHVDEPPYIATDPDLRASRGWLQAAGSLPDSPVLHSALFAYASDMSINDPFFHAIGRPRHVRHTAILTLSHTVRLVAQPNMNQWLLAQSECRWIASEHVECTSTFLDARGRMVGTCSQHAAWRAYD
jgi:acyl-CoA thioesterase-2